MNRDRIMKLLQSPNTDDFELGLNYAYKSMDKEQFGHTMKLLFKPMWAHDQRQEVFEVYGHRYKRAGNSVFISLQSMEECTSIGYKEIKLE